MMLAISRNKDPKASPPYLSLYHLNQAPFSGSAGGFYADPDRTQSLDMLQHLTQYSEELLLVTGPEGVGKSRLLERFLERSEEHWRVCRLDGSGSIEAQYLFQHIAECFGLDISRLSEAELLQGLQAQLSDLQEQQLPVLIIDDAERLSDDALEIVMYLAALEGEHGKLVRVLLFSDNHIESRLSTERFAAIQKPHRLELKALDESQTADYIDLRLESAGYRGEPLFSDKDIRQIHRQSQGLPGRINDEAHALLASRSVKTGGRAAWSYGQYLKAGVAATAIIGSVLGLHERINTLLGGDERAMAVTSPERPVMRLAEEGSPWAVVIRDGERIQISCGAPAGGTVGVRPVLSTAAMVQQPVAMSMPRLEDVSPTPASPEPAPAVEPERPPATAGEAEPPTEPPVAAQAPSESPPLVVKEDEPAESVAAVEEEAAPAVPEAVAPAELKLTGIDPSPVVGSEEPQRIVINGSGFSVGSKVAASRAGKVEVLPAENVTVIDDKRIAIDVITGTQPVGWAVQVSTPDNRRSNVLRFQVVAPPKVEKPAPVAAEPAEAAPAQELAQPKTAEVAAPKKPAVAPAKPAPARAPEQRLLGVNWLAGQPKGNFTLQLVASSNRDAVERYAKEKGLSGDLAHFVMDKGGKELHVLTLGSYPSRAAAEQAAKTLPRGVQPWIRTIESVQQVMKREAPVAGGQSADVVFPPTGAGIKDTAWVWSQDPGRYTIQLAAAESEQAIDAAMRRITLPGELVVVQTLREGKPWYALIYGSFASSEAARGTIDRLPGSLKNAGPWPRSFASLHDEISRSTPPR